MDAGDVNYDDIWKVADRARNSHFSIGSDNRRDAEWEDDPLDEEEAEPDPVVVPMGDGTYHVCLGQKCRYVEQTSNSEKWLVCRLSGLVVAPSFESAHDSSWTGRSCGSADPDIASGALSSKAWRFKRDNFADSARAYTRAKQLAEDDNGFEEYSVSLSSSKKLYEAEHPKTTKRGAPCVSELDEEAISEHKRTKAMKRITSLSRRDVQVRLNLDASNVVKKLFSMSPTTLKPPDAADPRLENYTFVFSIGLKRYANRCVEENEQLSLSTIHDLSICASNYVRERRREANDRQNQSKKRMLSVNTRTTYLCGRLIVSIWNAVCNTAHFVENQPGDSFKPFAAGIMYAMKRGVRLKSWLIVVPCIDVLSNQLPTLRSSSGNAEARQLQASSHRGLCAVHRAIASIDTMTEEDKKPVIDKLRVASEIASSIETFVAQYATNA